MYNLPANPEHLMCKVDPTIVSLGELRKSDALAEVQQIHVHLATFRSGRVKCGVFEDFVPTAFDQIGPFVPARIAVS